MPGAVMSFLRRRLAGEHGFRGYLFGYASVRGGLDENAARLATFLRRLDSERVDVVGHSLGGLIALRMLVLERELPAGRLVCLGSPLCGSRAARVLHGHRLGQRIVGRSLSEAAVVDRAAAWSDPVAGGRDVGVVTGNVAAGIGRLFAGFDEPNDGTVAVSETRLPGARDHIVLPVTHTGMLFSRAVADQAAAFLRHGRFRH